MSPAASASRTPELDTLSPSTVTLLEIAEPVGDQAFWSVWLDAKYVADGNADTPRAAMRAAEAEARRRGWLPEAADAR
jgi:hypothetical protein